ncbi:MAG: 4Fe-4S binding protein [Thermoplasmata archaeon]
MGMFSQAISNLFKKPFTKLYPAEKYEPIKDTRGRFVMDVTRCIFCGLCERNCPAAVIKVDKARKRHETVISGCILCYRCQEVCPKGCISFREHYAPPTVARTALVHEILPRGQEPARGAAVEERKDVEGGTAWAYTIELPLPGPGKG